MSLRIALVVGQTTTRALRVPRTNFAVTRCLHARPQDATSYDHRYAEKLQQRAKEKGLALDELRVQARAEALRKQKPEPPNSPGTSSVRKDSSPVKPLSSILNIPRLLAAPHTSTQISALWTAYHASRSGGTGRGFICASLPVESYNTMMSVAKRYPIFVVPLPRESTPDTSSDGNDASRTAHEFYFLQWDFHEPPPPPSSTEPDLFAPSSDLDDSSNLPSTSTVLFTPLQEYKLRTSFATPYLVLTFYPDLAQSHGIILLRGEITPSSASAATEQEPSGRFLLNQVDAQLLAMGIQRFYLWGEGRKEGNDRDSTTEELLKKFHEKPEEFDWQELIKHSNVTAA
ncbi:ATP11 protein-domain-containing protein [Phlebopus sp. FC_14]|nr:ATP11 protein-domain-containing protein [Phlebopus sp. FC_14]